MSLNPWKENKFLRDELQKVYDDRETWATLAGQRLMTVTALETQVARFNKSIFGRVYNHAKSLRFWMFGGGW